MIAGFQSFQLHSRLVDAMQLNHFTDFGLRTLIYLTGMPGGALVTIKEVATQFGLPHNHLNKIVGSMVKLGWVVATPGRNGGLRLAMPAASLLLGDVIRTLEGHPSLIDCDKPRCGLKGHCHLKRLVDLGLEDFYAGMNRYSLADLIKSPTAEVISLMHFQPAKSAH